MPTGEPFYEVPYSDPRKGMRKATIADARKVGALPSVTTILKILHKPALVDWLIEQAVLVALTSPHKPGEELDAFIQRVLHEERQQDQEAQKARDLGTAIHAAMETAMNGQQIPEELAPWVRGPVEALKARGSVVSTETVLVGDGFAGKTDLITQENVTDWLWDFKSAKKLPDPAKGGAWSEHRLQLAGYAAAYSKTVDCPVKTANLYISTIEAGKFVICEHDDWRSTYSCGFLPLVQHWQWANNYKP